MECNADRTQRVGLLLCGGHPRPGTGGACVPNSSEQDPAALLPALGTSAWDSAHPVRAFAVALNQRFSGDP